MTTLQFPSNPKIGDEYDYSPYKYYWDGQKWKTKGIGYNPVNDLRNELAPKVNSNTNGVFESLKRSYTEAGLNLVDGSFEEGGTLASTGDVLLYKTNGIAYSGPLGQVDAGTDPTVVGSGYVSRANLILRNELAGIGGADLIGGATYDQIRAYTGSADKIDCIGKVHAFDGAGGKFAVDLSDITSVDNDATVLVSASGVRWKRQYSGMIQPEWAGALRYTPSADCTAAIQKCLAIGPTEIAADFYVAGTLEINEGQSLIFTGGQLLQKTNATTTLRVNYGGEARDVLINTSAVNMDGTEPVPVIDIAPWDDPTKMEKTKVTGSIIGNFPNLQGIGVRMYAKTTAAGQTYSLIQFAHVDVSVYGLRDALVIDVSQFETSDIVYVNSSYIKVYSKNCYRPARLLNAAGLEQISTGHCCITDNDFDIGAQHYTGNEEMVLADGCTVNRFNLRPSDWNSAYWIDLTVKSSGNSVDGSIPVANASKIRDSSGANRVKRREEVAAHALFDGLANTLIYASGGYVEKLSTGSYALRFNEPFSGVNTYIALAQGSAFSVANNYPIIISPTADKTANYCVFDCRRADTGALVDIPGISFMAVGR